MASRGTYLSRSAKRPAEHDHTDKGSTGLSRKSSVTSSSTNTSKIPASSWFSRSKHTRTQAAPSNARQEVPTEKPSKTPERRVEVPISKSEPVVSTASQTSKSHGLGISSWTPSSHVPQVEPGNRQRNVLRRRAPLRDQISQYARTDSSASSYEPTPPAKLFDTASTPAAPTAPHAGSVFGVALPPASTSTSFLPASSAINPDQATSSSRMAVYNKRRAPEVLSTQDLPPPTPNFAHSSTSSTRRSESPSSFSRTSTPTSMSSHSPAMPYPTKSPLRTRPLSPHRSRPPVTRWRMGRQGDAEGEERGLAALRESVTSSSSSSTVKGPERNEHNQSRHATYRLSPPPPSPPLGGGPAAQLRGSSVGSLERQQPGSLRHRRQGFYSPPPSSDEMLQNAAALPGPNRFVSAPTRPSREGTPQLDDYIDPSPIIQSNLDRLVTTGHKRRKSLEKADGKRVLPQSSPSGLSRSPSSASNTSARPSRLPYPSSSSALHVLSDPEKPQRPQVPRLRVPPPSEPKFVTARSVKEPSPQSASSAKSSTRFGLFSRRTRSPVEPSNIDALDKAAKKGPAAGTGHEGYGKYSRRGRSSSISTSASRGRSTSTSGTASSVGRNPLSRKGSITSRGEPEMDDFLRDRLAPVYLNGGGMVENRQDGVDSSETSGKSLPNLVASDIRFVGRPPFTPKPPQPYATSTTASEERKRLRRESRTIPSGHSFPSEATGLQHRGSSSESDMSRPTLAARRSLHRSRLVKEVEVLKVPAPIKTGVLVSSPMNSRDTVPTSPPGSESTTFLSDEISEGREGNWLKPKRKEKRSRSPNKWNFFQRALTSTQKPLDPRYQENETSMGALPATVSRLPESRPVPFYAMLDSSEQEDSNNIGRLVSADQPMQDGSAMSPTSPDAEQRESTLRRLSDKKSILLPSPPTFPTEFTNSHASLSPAKSSVRQQNPAPSETITALPPKPRVPRLQQVGRIPRVVSKRDRLHKPPPQSFSRPFARHPASTTERLLTTAAQGDYEDAAAPSLRIHTEIPFFDTRGGLQSAKPATSPLMAPDTDMNIPIASQPEFLTFPPRQVSEASGGSSSSGIAGSAATIATTAVVPAPESALDEDEVWNEYNDFLDTVSPAPLSEQSTLTSDYLKKGSKMAPAPLHIRKESPPKSLHSPFSDPALSRDLPQPPSMSKLLSPRQSGGDTVSSPMSFSDFFAGYADRNRISVASKHQSYSSGSRYSIDSLQSRRTSGAHSKRNTQIMAEKTEASESQSNLRFSALMTSRWLSFGRVLFSPAHNEIQGNRQDRVLVVDGLGNDDWSFYCALTYPNAIIYNLSPSQRSSGSSARKREIGAYDSPVNHRQIFHTSISHPFPFPKGFFSAAVFRFPVASSEAAYTSAISEFKRVLQPGGYLELSILDLDMVNMGNRARRAVRMLKVRMQVADPEVSLKPNSDSIQKMLGRRGFENLKSCMVDVPVAGHISSSRTGSIDEENKSLGDMLKDSSNKGDESITKMVAKVGRWWYTRCYEMGVLPSNNNDDTAMEHSIWNDTQLLKECEKRETGLKLLICHAQKPNAVKRRTISI